MMTIGSDRAATSASSESSCWRLPPSFRTSMGADLDGVETREIGAGPFIPCESHCERLDRLPCGPLHQVVEGAHDHDAPGVRVALEADVAIVRAGQNLW